MKEWKEKLRYLQREFCRMCEEKDGAKDVDECFGCMWHKLFNGIIEVNA